MSSHDDSSAFNRRTFLQASLAGGAALALGPRLSGAGDPEAGLAIEEATIDQLREGLEAGRWTSRDLTVRYLARIGALDQNGPKLNAVIETNPDAISIAETLDEERRKKGSRGHLHGIPILLKDNLDTADRMMTTAGSLALVDAPKPARDAFVVQKLREAGAVILGKTNLSEWANLRSTRSTSGWSGRGGQTKNPYALDRNPSGSSSGSAVAVASNLCAAAIGTETDGSIVSPASMCSLVGLKPTLGLWSRSGIIPIAHSQDTAGPMTRTVRDAAILLGAVAGVDPADRATAEARGNLYLDYTRHLDPKGLKGARLGRVKNFMGQHAHMDRVMQSAWETLSAQGAVLVDLELISKQFEDAELEVLLYEFKADLNAYLGVRGGPAKSMADLIAFNEKFHDKEMPFFGQELFLQAQAKGPLTDAAYLKAVATCQQARRDMDTLLAQHKLDAFVAPTGTPPWLTDPVNGDNSGLSCSTYPAVAGCPHITVPAGFVFGLPLGLSFFGRAWSEATLLKFAFAFEQATKARRTPKFLPTALS